MADCKKLWFWLSKKKNKKKKKNGVEHELSVLVLVC